MEQGILLSAGDDVDFMIHGIFPYQFFGHTVWITTTHVCVLIVLMVLIGFAIAAFVTGYIACQVEHPSLKRLLTANFVGLFIVYFFGLINFMVKYQSDF